MLGHGLNLKNSLRNSTNLHPSANFTWVKKPMIAMQFSTRVIVLLSFQITAIYLKSKTENLLCTESEDYPKSFNNVIQSDLVNSKNE